MKMLISMRLHALIFIAGQGILSEPYMTPR